MPEQSPLLKILGSGSTDAPIEQPTRAQVALAFNRVKKTAPDGIDREGFFKLLDAEVQQVQQADKANRTPLKEPTTWLGGFLKSASDQMGAGMEGMAHPQTPGDFLSLIGLTNAPLAIKGLKATPSLGEVPKEPIGNRAARFTARRAADVLDFTPNIVKSSGENRIIGGLKKFGEAPAERYRPESIVDRYKANQSGYAPGESSYTPTGGSGLDRPEMVEPDIVDRYKANQSGYVPESGAESAPTAERVPYGDYQAKPALDTGRMAGKAPTLESVLLDAVQSAREPEAPMATTAAPGIETAGEGALKQSGKFPTKGRPGAGGYSSGRPGVTDTRYNEMIDKFGETGEGAGAETQPLSASASEPVPSNTPEQMGGGEPPSMAEESGSPHVAPDSGGPQVESSSWPPNLAEDWHSEVPPGTPEAARARQLHIGTRELDTLYRHKLSDPLAALLLSIGGAGALHGGSK